MKHKIILAALVIGFFAVNAAEAVQPPAGSSPLPPVVGGTPPNGQPAPQVASLCYDIKAIANKSGLGKTSSSSKNQKVVLSVTVGNAKAQDFQLLTPELLCLQGTSKPKSTSGGSCFGNKLC